jgi:hypothetical protein
VAGIKVKAIHLRNGIVIRRRQLNLARCYIEDMLLASFKNKKSKTKEFDEARRTFMDLMIEGLFPVDTAMCLTSLKGTGGKKLGPFHMDRLQVIVGEYNTIQTNQFK